MKADPNPFAPPKANLEGSVQDAGPAPPLWNPDAAGLWSLLFSPIFGSTLVMKNYQALGEDALARSARNWLIGSIFMLFVTAFLGGLGLVWIIVWYFAFQRKQTLYIRERWGKEYPRRGWGVPLLIALGVLVGIWALIIGVLVAVGR